MRLQVPISATRTLTEVADALAEGARCWCRPSDAERRLCKRHGPT